MTCSNERMVDTKPLAANPQTDDRREASIKAIHNRSAVAINDPALRHLLLLLLRVMARPEAIDRARVDLIVSRLATHLTGVYGKTSVQRRTPRGGLAPWQLRRAQDLFRANLNGDVSLNRLAAECNLSVRHFTRAFRQSTGLPPHRWLLQHRVECAKKLLRQPTLPLADVALSCGFCDQSHFTRVFSAVAGVSPGAWRRARL